MYNVVWYKISFSVVLGLLTFSSFAGDFKKISDGNYKYSGSIESSDIKKYTDIIGQNKNLTISINSTGGNYETGLELGQITVKNKVHIVVDQAFSSAGYWSLGDKNHGFKNKDSLIAIHLPFVSDENFNIPPELYMTMGVELCDYLELCGFKHNESENLISKMAELRFQYGHEAYVVWKSDGMYILTVKPKDTSKSTSVKK